MSESCGADWLDRLSGDDLVSGLRHGIGSSLPGRRAHRRAAVGTGYGRHAGPSLLTARPAAVLVLLFREQGRWLVPMTLRPQHLSHHPGQVCFPGGAAHPGETSQQTALRETEEELGFDTRGLELLGPLSPLYVFASNHLVQPIVAVAKSRPSFHPDPREVEQLLELPLAETLQPDNWEPVVIARRGLQFTAASLTLQSHQVWGASCMILAELTELIETLGSDLASPPRT